eukprot:gene32008-5041_t
MDIDVMQLNALTVRSLPSQKDKSNSNHEHVQEQYLSRRYNDRLYTPVTRPQRDYQSPSSRESHPIPSEVEMLSALQTEKIVPSEMTPCSLLVIQSQLRRNSMLWLRA